MCCFAENLFFVYVGLEPRFNGLVKNTKFKDVPIIFADLSCSENQPLIKSLGVVALPTLQFYANGKVVDTFPAGPKALPTVTKKLDQFISQNLSDDGTVKSASEIISAQDQVKKESSEDEAVLTLIMNQKPKLEAIPYFESISDYGFEDLLKKASLLTFQDGSVIMREGDNGDKFYLIIDGDVEVCRRTISVDEDSTKTSPAYLGTVVNKLGKGAYFGERSLITGEPRAASIRASSTTQVLTFSKEHIPATCILSGLSVAKDRDAEKERLDATYGINSTSTGKKEKTPYVDVNQESIIPLLIKFKLIRSVASCFDYIVSNGLSFGRETTRSRRNKLFQMLTKNQQSEFKDAFDLIDTDKDGEISLLELRRIMNSIGQKKTEEELLKVIESPANDDEDKLISEEDFMGLMAEAEIYNLLLGTFQALDENNGGYIKANDLNNILSGVQGLISDDRKNLINLDDEELEIDYDQFSKMLLGSYLK